MKLVLRITHIYNYLGESCFNFLGSDLFFGDWIHGPENMEQLKELVAKYSHPITLVEDDFNKSIHIYRQNLGLEFITGYIIEYSLSIDNIFVILMIFYSFGVKKNILPSGYYSGVFWEPSSCDFFLFLSVQH